MFGPSSLKTNIIESIHLMGGCSLQLALKVTPSKVSEIVAEISKKAVGCRTKVVNDMYMYTNDECPIFRIPDNFPHLEEAQIVRIFFNYFYFNYLDRTKSERIKGRRFRNFVEKLS